MSTDNQIKEAIADDLDSGFIDLVKTHQRGIYSGTRRLVRHHQDAEDIAQDTFIRAYKALESYETRRILDLEIRGWLWTIALNLCRTHGKRASRPYPIRDHESMHNDRDSLDESAWNQRLNTLSHDQRTAVVLRHVVDLSIDDITTITGRPVGTVKSDISRGLARLKDTLEVEGTRE